MEGGDDDRGAGHGILAKGLQQVRRGDEGTRGKTFIAKGIRAGDARKGVERSERSVGGHGASGGGAKGGVQRKSGAGKNRREDRRVGRGLRDDAADPAGGGRAVQHSENDKKHDPQIRRDKQGGRARKEHRGGHRLVFRCAGELPIPCGFRAGGALHGRANGGKQPRFAEKDCDQDGAAGQGDRDVPK